MSSNLQSFAMVAGFPSITSTNLAEVPEDCKVLNLKEGDRIRFSLNPSYKGSEPCIFVNLHHHHEEIATRAGEILYAARTSLMTTRLSSAFIGGLRGISLACLAPPPQTVARSSTGFGCSSATGSSASVPPLVHLERTPLAHRWQPSKSLVPSGTRLWSTSSLPRTEPVSIPFRQACTGARRCDGRGVRGSIRSTSVSMQSWTTFIVSPLRRMDLRWQRVGASSVPVLPTTTTP